MCGCDIKLFSRGRGEGGKGEEGGVAKLCLKSAFQCHGIHFFVASTTLSWPGSDCQICA